LNSEKPPDTQPHRENLHVHYSAEDYDRYTDRFVEVYDASMLKRLKQEMRARAPEGVLLDVGTGTARLLVKMAAVPELSGLRLVGIDFFEDMIVAAQRAVAESGLEGRVELRQADAHDLPFPDGFADYVISRSTIHHWTNPPRALREIYRVLKPGGVALIHDVRRDPAPDVLAQFNEQRRLAGVEPCRLEEKYTAAEVRAFLEEAGLGDHATVEAAESGPGALGFEVRITK
jgi:ubiquinone/menaquinone biosynthesis C-methylase UbiE